MLQSFVEQNNLERRSAKWTSVGDCDLADFPHLTDEQLRTLTCGIYQLKLCSSYIQEHVDGDSDIHVYKDDRNLVRVRIQSRHTSSKKYMLWIKYNATEICAWYCKCRTGARVVGVCAHIAAVVWYLSQAKHDADRTSFGVRDWSVFLTDASKLPESVDSSDTASTVSAVEE